MENEVRRRPAAYAHSDLVTSLRRCVKGDDCKNCNLYDHDGCTDELLDAAADALEVLSDYKERIGHIKAIQYTTLFEDMVAYFDDREISPTEVIEYIESGRWYHRKIVCVSRIHAEKVFGFQWEEENKKTGGDET